MTEPLAHVPFDRDTRCGDLLAREMAARPTGSTSSADPWTSITGGFAVIASGNDVPPAITPDNPTTAAGASLPRSPTCRAIIAPWLKPTSASRDSGNA